MKRRAKSCAARREACATATAGDLIVAGQSHQPAQRTRNTGEVVCEVLVEQDLHLVGSARSVERRQHVEESKQARAEPLIGDRVGQQPVFDLFVHARPVALHLLEECRADGSRAGLDTY